jgi:hypothetical protein
MASKTTLTLENLQTLGAERLADMVMEFAQGDALLKRLLRLELTGHHSPPNL